MSIQLKRIGHVGILVSDFERSFRFYTEVLGCRVTNRNKRPDGPRQPSSALTTSTTTS
jgi:catechol 2,3-dioxygenase-like lactoylglutathione lyase family enzyme